MKQSDLNINHLGSTFIIDNYEYILVEIHINDKISYIFNRDGLDFINNENKDLILLNQIEIDLSYIESLNLKHYSLIIDMTIVKLIIDRIEYYMLIDNYKTYNILDEYNISYNINNQRFTNKFICNGVGLYGLSFINNQKLIQLSIKNVNHFYNYDYLGYVTDVEFDLIKKSNIKSIVNKKINDKSITYMYIDSDSVFDANDIRLNLNKIDNKLYPFHSNDEVSINEYKKQKLIDYYNK